MRCRAYEGLGFGARGSGCRAAVQVLGYIGLEFVKKRLLGTQRYVEIAERLRPSHEVMTNSIEMWNSFYCRGSTPNKVEGMLGAWFGVRIEYVLRIPGHVMYQG